MGEYFSNGAAKHGRTKWEWMRQTTLRVHECVRSEMGWWWHWALHSMWSSAKRHLWTLNCHLSAHYVHFAFIFIQWNSGANTKKIKINIQQKQAKRREAQHNIRTTAGEPEGAASDKMTSLTRAAPQPLSTAAATPTANRQTHARAPATKHLQLHWHSALSHCHAVFIVCALCILCRSAIYAVARAFISYFKFQFRILIIASWRIVAGAATKLSMKICSCSFSPLRVSLL